MLFNNEQQVSSHDASLKQHSRADGRAPSDQRTQSQEEIIRITIDLGNNRAENIIVLRGQEKKSNELAQEFCEKHGFMNIQAALAKQIQMNIDQILQNSSDVTNSYINDDFKSSNSPDQLAKDEKEVVSGGTEPGATIEKPLDSGDGHQNAKTNTESATNSGRDEEDREKTNRPGAAASKDHLIARHSKSFNSNAHRSQMSHFDVIQKQTNYNMFAQGVLQEPPEPVSAAVRPPNQLDAHRNEMEQMGGGHAHREKATEVPVSDLVSYDGGPSNLLNEKLTDHSNYFSNNSHEQVQSVKGPPADQFEREIADVSLDQRLVNLPQQKLNIHLQNPECRPKPEINEVSRLLAAGKRSGEPIHERLYKQETLSKKIATQLRAGSRQGNEPTSKRSKSSEQRAKQNQSKLHNRSVNDAGADSRSIPRVRSANRFRNDEKIEQIQNPGERLYQRGIQMEQEKKRLIEQARLEMEQTELDNHCTFQPQLVTSQYYMSQNTRNFLSQEYDEFDEENLHNGLTNEFNEESAQKRKRPAVSIEKMIIKDGETIHLHRPYSPKLMAQGHPQQPMGMLHPGAYRGGPERASESRDQMAKTTSERLLNYGRQIHLKRQMQAEEWQAQQTANFAFKPKINSRSRSLANQKRNLQNKSSKQNDSQMEDGQRALASDLLSKSQLAHCDDADDSHMNPHMNSYTVANCEQGRNKVMSSYFSQQVQANAGQHLGGEFQGHGHGRSANQPHADLQEDCDITADELSQPNSQCLNDKSFSNQTNYYVGNPTQMPGGDDDDILEDEALFEDEQELLGPSNLDVSETLEGEIDHSRHASSLNKSSFNPLKSKAYSTQQRQMQKEEKFMALYDDAKHRILRKEHIYSNCIDQECTFKPKLITQHSKVSKTTVKEVQQVVRNKSKHIAEALAANKENVNAADSAVVLGASLRHSSSGNLRRNEKPAVAGVTPQEFLTNSRLMYLTNRDAKTKEPHSRERRAGAAAKHHASAEGQVFVRLAKQAEIYHNLQRQKRELQDQSIIHPKSGREMFKPQINTTFQLRDRATSGTDVTHKLHNRHKFILEKKEKARVKAQDKLNQMRNQGKASKFSEQIVMQTRRNKMGEIFDRLDADQDGLISTEKMELSALSEDMHELFKPLLLELEQLQEPLNKEEFVDATNRLYETLNQHQKNLILRFNKRAKKSDYLMEKCTFKPQTNSLFNQALQKTSAIMQLRRPGSAHPAQSQVKSNLPDQRSVLSGRRDQNQPPMNRRAYKPQKQHPLGTSLMDRILDNGERTLNRDLAVYQRPVPPPPQIHRDTQDSQSQIQTIPHDNQQKAVAPMNPSHFRMRSFSNSGAQGPGNPLSIQNGINQLQREDSSTQQPSHYIHGAKQEQVAAVIEPLLNASKGHDQSNQSTATKPMNERAIQLSQLPITLSLDQSDANVKVNHNQSHFEHQSVMKLPEATNQPPAHGNQHFAHTHSKKAEKNFNLSHFMERKTSLRSPKSSSQMVERLPQKHHNQPTAAHTAKTSVRDKTSRQNSAKGVPPPQQQQFNLNLDHLRNEVGSDDRKKLIDNAERSDKQRLSNLGEERQKSKERRHRMAQSKSPSANRREVTSFENVQQNDDGLLGSQAAPRSPVKIAVKDLLLDQTPKAIQERLYSHEVQPGGRALRSQSRPGSGSNSQSQTMKKKRRTAAERAEQKSQMSSIAADERMNARNTDSHPLDSIEKQ